jgi:Pre-mRNA splicing factor/N-terminal domain of CBF1 interacting co-repressor CIR
VPISLLTALIDITVFSLLIMGGNINIKKSWDPTTFQNQQTVWAAENRAREQRNLQDQNQKEIAEERRRQELQRLQDTQGGSPSQERVEWMYSAPPSGTQGISAEKEEYLLGRKRVDKLICGKENRIGGDAVASNGTGADCLNKVLMDPLLAIQQRKFAELSLLSRKKRREREEQNDKEYSKRYRRRGRDLRRNDERRGDHRDEEEYSSARPRGLDEMRRVRDGHPRDVSPVLSHRRRSPCEGNRIIPSYERERNDYNRTAALQAMRLDAEKLESSRAILLAREIAKDETEQERQEGRFHERTGGHAKFIHNMWAETLEYGRITSRY